MSLPDGSEAWTCRGAGDAVLLLGLGPMLEAGAGGGLLQRLPQLAGASAVFWLESPHMAQAVQSWRTDAGLPPREPLPESWREVSVEQAFAMAAQCRCYIYMPGVRIDPDFWGPLLGQMDAVHACPQTSLQAASQQLPPKISLEPVRHGVSCLAADMARGFCARSSSKPVPVLLPGNDGLLLHQELRAALLCSGFRQIVEDLPQPDGAAGEHSSINDDTFAARWRDLLEEGKPAFLLSVNLRGLDADGRIFHLCRALGIPVALWFVDNPWHVLSGVRLPWWRDAHVFVTDASFVDSLRAEGARRVFHLPLAVAPHMWRDLEAESSVREPPLFVGRSAFPEKERFFAAASVPQALEAEAAKVLEASTGPHDAPHFFWWHNKLGGALWPGYDVRRPGLGAERCAQANRRRWLFAAGAGRDGGARIIGDDGWKALLPAAGILPPVDYYASLPEIYARAEAVLNVTSLLLPYSLSQRHFDVWASGGLLLSDATPGLEIFPPELTEPIKLQGPADFMPRCAWFRAHPQEALELRHAWREHIRAQHSYEQRIQRILEVLD